MKTQTEQNRTSGKTDEASDSRSRGGENSTKRDQSSSQRATTVAKRGELLEAKTPKDRSPKQENL